MMASATAYHVPDRSLAQRMSALEEANRIRSMRAQFKRDLKARRKNAHDYLLDPPEWLETMKIIELLLAVPKYGRVKANKVLQLSRISPSKTVGGMSARQRAEIVSMLRK
jgi:hypothetical protein